MSRPRPGAVLGRVLAALALTPVLLVGTGGAAVAGGEEPAVVPTAVLPDDDEPSRTPEPEPHPEPEPEPVTTPAPEAAHSPDRTAPVTSRSPTTPAHTSSPAPVATLLEEVTGSPSPLATPTRRPLVDGLDRDDPDPTPEPAPATDDGAPADPLVRLVQLVVAGAVLLGVGGGVGLYLTREGR